MGFNLIWTLHLSNAQISRYKIRLIRRKAAEEDLRKLKHVLREMYTIYLVVRIKIYGFEKTYLKHM